MSFSPGAPWQARLEHTHRRVARHNPRRRHSESGWLPRTEQQHHHHAATARRGLHRMPWLDPRVKDNAGRMHARFGDDHARNGMTYQDRRPSCRASTRSAEATASGSVVSGFCTEVALKPLCLQSGDDFGPARPAGEEPRTSTTARAFGGGICGHAASGDQRSYCALSRAV